MGRKAITSKQRQHSEIFRQTPKRNDRPTEQDGCHNDRDRNLTNNQITATRELFIEIHDRDRNVTTKQR